jgi:cyclic beta-1,2-glucan synthetase
MTIDILSGQKTSPENGARQLAKMQKIRPDLKPEIDIYRHLPAMPGWLAKLRDYCRNPDLSHSKAADWLLDNDYQVLRAIRQLVSGLPEHFFARLTVVEDPAENRFPRVFEIAHALSARDGVQLSMQNIVHYVSSFQNVAPLSTAELWALPSMLRLANLEMLASAFHRLHDDLTPPFDPSRSFDDGNPADLIAQAIINLSAVHSITWPDFFDRTSLVEATLKGDPAGVYSQMEFATRDRYRRIIEQVADRSELSEIEVAGQTVKLSADQADDQRRGHVGYWLIGEGRCALEEQVNCKLPLGERLCRKLFPLVQLGYASALLFVVVCALAVPIYHLRTVETSVWAWIFAISLSTLPASVLSVSLVHWLITLMVSPRLLPALNFRKRIPDDCVTAVVVPVIVSTITEIARITDLLETRRLANPDPNLHFVLLSDLPDAEQELSPGDNEIERALVSAIRVLNERHGSRGIGPFFLLHRRRLFNQDEGCWMGWERKRGKLEQFNQLVLGGPPDGFPIREGETAALKNSRFVITLDADTMLPPGTASQLIGTLAHPLNTATFEEKSGRIISGYSILQPRMEILPSVSSETPFSHLCAGDTAIDIYTNAVSDIYQDIFGTGIFVGKGIYEVATLQRCLDDCVPENTILSHDLFEGLFCRAALVTNIVLYENFPPTYTEYAWRQHRWLRGDWQLVPWLGKRVRTATGELVSNPFSVLDRWKIIDNLRRSLVPPTLLLFFVAGWMILPGSAWLWTLMAAAAPGIYLVGEFFAGLSRTLQRGVLGDLVHRLRERGGRWFLTITFLVSDTVISLDAILRTLWRLFVSRRHLLEWRSAAHTAARVADRNTRSGVWRFMWPSTAISVLLAIDLALYDRTALLPAAPVLLLWFIAPEIAVWTGRPRILRRETLNESQSGFLTRIARRTWHYFETFAGPQDNWLPPDNFQENPRNDVAHRTSPTNIGLFLVSALSARDFGFIGNGDFTSRSRHALSSLQRMETYRGHWLNWYETGSLEPLQPRYVSTVDSGNLAVCLLALKHGSLEIQSRPAVDPGLWRGLDCVFDLLLQAVQQLSGWSGSRSEYHRRVFETHIADADRSPENWQRVLDRLSEQFWPELEKAIAEAIEKSDPPAAQLLNDLHVWLERFDHHLRAMRRDVDTFLPWLKRLDEPPSGQEALASSLLAVLKPTAPISSAGISLDLGTASIDRALRNEPSNSAAANWLRDLRHAIERGLQEQGALLAEILDVAKTASTMAFGMDFKFLYDPDVRLFRIGYNLSSGQVDPSHYDLLATEARLASFFAIAKHDAPLEHWFFLGRPITRLRGKPSILSWNGSMFEYLMPPLFLPGKRDTLLGESEATAVEYQRGYAERRGVPWGISESAFGVTDAEGNYQYRAFGAPGLGIRRGLTDDLVIAPYASALALCVWPGAAVRNLQNLEKLGAAGAYGFIDALDYTPDRAPERNGFVPVRTYMAHHQGMTMAAITNVLKNDLLIERVLREKPLRAIDHLLQERIPWGLPTEKGRVDETWDASEPSTKFRHSAPWMPSSASTVPQVHIIGNGQMSMRLSAAGGGGLFWNNMALTRWLPDPTGDRFGYWIYIRDVETDALWSIGRGPTGQKSPDERVIFHQHMVEMVRRDHAITSRMEVTVAPGENVEIRQMTVTNEENTERVIEFTSYAEVVLAAPLDDERHPAFSKLFVTGSYLPGQDGLVFERRARRPEAHYPVLLHRLVTGDPDIRVSSYETDRGKFVGRNGVMRSPCAFTDGLSQTTGWTLDPIMSLQIRIQLKPMQTKHFSFVTIAADTRVAALEIARRYQTPSLEWVFKEASRDLARETGRLEIDPQRLPELQALSSLLLQPCPALRESCISVSANRHGQPDLWRFGISGDLPILLLRIADDAGSGTLELLVRAQQLWRRGGLQTDIVVLRTGMDGYEEPIRDRVLSILHDTHAYGFLGRTGGIHLLSAGHMDADSRRAVEAAAHIVLGEDEDSLGLKLDRVMETRSLPPHFEPLVPVVWDEIAPLARPDNLDFENGYGGFDGATDEYRIHLEPGDSTPAPWCNVLANETFGSIVSEAGLGFTWAVNSGENRLTPWSNDPVVDPQGEILYLRDDATAKVWTVTPAPLGHDATCQIDHGCGYTRWKQHSHALEQEILAFSPVDGPVRIIRLRLKNPTGRARRITATYYAEWLLGALRSMAAPRVVSEYDAALHSILANNAWNPEFASRTAFLTASHPPHSVSGDRYDFLGKEGCVEEPAALRHWDLGGRFTAGADLCAAYQVQIHMASDETREIVFVLGQGKDRGSAVALIRQWQSPQNVEKAFTDLQRFWTHRCRAVEVETPDPAFNLMINQWLPYQTLSSRVMARAGFYQAGGAYGFRDQLQDVLALLHSDPTRVREHILLAAQHQFEEGDALHWWHPPSGRGVRTRCSDDYLWLAFVAAQYVKATGDTSIFDENVPFLKGPELLAEQHDHYAQFETGEMATLFEHCARALDRMTTTGRHGLPLMGTGDWNDGMDRVGIGGEGESVWLAWFQIAVVRKLSGLAVKRGEKGRAERWRRYVRRLKSAIEKHAWDGDWFIRAFDDDGRPWGSQSLAECQIDSIAQSWSVLSGTTIDERAKTALASARNRLVSEPSRLIKLLDPPFDKTPRDPGYIKSYPPGIRENGGQYTHAAAWLGLAFARTDDGDTAWQLFDIINPIRRSSTKADAERYEREPYAVAADVSALTTKPGLGGWSWYTGAASWSWQLGVEGILGVHLVAGALRIDPHLPKNWGGANMVLRSTQGVIYLTIEDPEHLGSGVKWIKLDGERLRGSTVRFPGENRTCEVVVKVGLKADKMKHTSTKG